MPTKKKLEEKNFSIFLVIISAVLTILGLYILGNAQDIQVTYNAPTASSTKLIVLHTLLFFTMYISVYSVFLINLRKSLRVLAFLLATGLIYFTFYIPFVHQYQPPLSQTYILLGDRLANIHGINWFWMDWANWMTTAFCYLLAVYTAVIVTVIKLSSRYLNK